MLRRGYFPKCLMIYCRGRTPGRPAYNTSSVCPSGSHLPQGEGFKGAMSSATPKCIRKQYRGSKKSLSKGKAFSSLFFRHSVANADFSEYISGLGGVFLNFSADICHVHSQHLIIALCRRTPKLSEFGILGEYLDCIFRTKANSEKLNLGEL